MSRTERLVNLVAFLADAPRPVAAAQIMADVPGYAHGGEAARRTFERDKDTLRELGLALETVPIDRLGGMDPANVGYRLPPSEPVDDPGLDLEERSALAVAAALALGDAGPLGGDLGAGAAAGAGAGTGVAAAAAATPPVAFSGTVAPPLVEAVTVAAAQRRVITFTYETPGPPPQRRERRVSPYGVLHRRGNWYVVGADSVSGEQRSFRLDRVVGDVDAGAPGAFERPPGFRVSDAVADRGWERGDGAALAVVIAVDPHRLWWVAPQAHGEAGPPVEVAGRQWPTLTVRVRNPEAFVTWVLSLLDAAVVVTAGDLRDEVVARLDAIVATGAAPGRAR